MKLSAVLAVAAAAAAAAAAAGNQQGTRRFVALKLGPPYNRLPGEKLWPKRSIYVYKAYISKYTTDTWAAYVLDQCRSNNNCTSAMSSSVRRTSDGVWDWQGILFSGPPISEEDYRTRGANDSLAANLRAWTIAV